MADSQTVPAAPASFSHESPRQAAARARRAGWLRTLHQWHWISAALSLAGLLLFSVTGFTLNHAEDIEAKPVVLQREATLPDSLTVRLQHLAMQQDGQTLPLPADARDWLAQSPLALQLPDAGAEWSPAEIYLSLPRPGGDAWLRIDLAAGLAEYELTHRGWISYLNDLHKGRHTGAVWSGFIDVFAAACLVFALTGLFILKLHAGQRRSTWPITGLGFVAPLLIALLFIH